MDALTKLFTHTVATWKDITIMGMLIRKKSSTMRYFLVTALRRREDGEVDENEIDWEGGIEGHLEMKKAFAAYLMRIKEMHNLAQNSLEDIIRSTTTIIDNASKSVCVNIARQLQHQHCVNNCAKAV